MKLNWNFTVNALILFLAAMLILVQQNCWKPFLKNWKMTKPAATVSLPESACRELAESATKPSPKSPLSASGSSQQTPKPLEPFQDIEFPENFLFGTAYSYFQTAGISRNSDWVEFAKKTYPPPLERYLDAANSNYLERYKTDFALAGKLGIQIHRLSLDWSVYEPEEGRFDKKTLDDLKIIFALLRENGIEPMPCLNHFPVPIWFAELGGWENPKAAFYFSRYAEVIAEKVGLPLKIRWWLTFNEPQIFVGMSYAKGKWPPYKYINGFADQAGTERFIRAMSNVMEAHRLSYKAIHRIMDPAMEAKENQKAMVGWASAPQMFYPQNPNSTLDKDAVNLNGASQTIMLDYALGNSSRDFIGLNYYGRYKLRFHISVWPQLLAWLTPEKPFAFQWETPEQRKQGERPKEFYPKGLYDLIMKFKPAGQPILITENGLDDADDRFREEFIVLHLKAVHDAIRDGAAVIGYQYWSLSDTWEPADGRFASFGLIVSKSENAKIVRKIRSSALSYAEIIKTHKIPAALLEKHKELLIAQES